MGAMGRGESGRDDSRGLADARSPRGGRSWSRLVSSREKAATRPRARRHTREEMIKFRVEIEQEADGRWIAEVVELPGVIAYGSSQQMARAKVQALASRMVADRREHGEADPIAG